MMLDKPIYKKLFYWFFLAFSFSIPLSSFISTRLLLVLLLVSFILGGGYKRVVEFSWDLIFYMVVLILGIAYSSDHGDALKVIETSFSFIALSLILVKRDEFGSRGMFSILYFFSFGLFIACLICIGNASIRYIQSSDPSVFYFYNLSDIVNSHPTYFAYYLIFAITLGLYTLHYEKPIFHPVLIALLIIFFFLVLLLTGGQTAFVSVLLVFSFFLLRFFLGDRSDNQKITIKLVMMMMSIMFFVSLTQNGAIEDNLNDSWDRFALWKSAINANTDPIFGVGTGDYKFVLNDYFRKHDLEEFAMNSFNSHNQFIQIYLSNGLIGLLALILMLARPLYLAFKSNSSFGILVFFPFLIYAMTEVFLGRYQGVVFFALLHQVFVSNYSSKSEFSLKEA